VDGDGCSAACFVESFCGNGVLDAGEACDDGNGLDGDGCSAACFVESFCGDGVVDAGEACDDGNRVDGDGCSTACAVEARCGDGVVDAGEACDDGNNVDGDRCSAACLVEPFCGDGLLDAGEACDDGNGADGDGCSAVCAVEPRCGDGALDAGEACDDGNTDPGDGCAADCSVEAPVCGNGRREAGEGCDDGNLDGGDGCGPTCRPEACGDGFLRAPEECDDGNVNAADGCDGLCLVEAVDITGGGRFLGGFQAGSFDRFTFTLAARSTVRLDTSDGAAGCPGDTEAVILDAQGVEITGDSGDGECAAVRTELPAGRFTLVVRAAGGVGLNRYTLDAAFIAVPVQVCGDRVLGDAEECDDGNVNAGDGCDAACRVEPVDISAGGDFFGSFPARSLDRYVFRLAGPHQVGLSTGDGVGGCPGDTRMVLSAAGGGEQARAEDGAVGACAALSLRMDVGQYLLVVDNAARGAVGAYFLNARFRPIRDPGAACDPTQRLDLCADGSECRGNPAICRVGACGDGVVNPGEQCDDRNVVAGDGCDAACRTEACGNGRVDAGEQCDDGNVVPGDGCDAGCRDEAFCGDGAVDPGEACDDGNTRPGDGCDDTCQREPVCGDGMINVAGEQCDDGNTRPGDGCDEICRREPVCGDGMINVAGEQCDDGNRNNGDGCDSQCRREPACGDGVVNQANEQCDDGNRNNGDGCSAQCQREAPPNLCGNNRLDAGEACDDGNLREGDGCDSLCSFELYTLIGARSTVQGRIPAGGRDILRFIVDDRSYIGALTTALGGVGCAGDTVLSLYRIQGNRQLVAQDDDTAGNGCSLLRFEPLAAGTYELEVTARAALLDYQVDVFHSVIVDRLGLFNGTFVAGGDDNFSFGLDGFGVIFLETLGCGGDTIMTLFLVDANGDLVELAFDDDGGVGAVFLHRAVPRCGGLPGGCARLQRPGSGALPAVGGSVLIGPGGSTPSGGSG
jgi:cysteine-rich repeat protein